MLIDIFRFARTLLGTRYVVLIDYDGERCVRPVIFQGGKPYAKRVGFGIRTVGLLDSGALTNGCYAASWEPYRPLAPREFPEWDPAK